MDVKAKMYIPLYSYKEGPDFDEKKHTEYLLSGMQIHSKLRRVNCQLLSESVDVAS